MRRMLTLGAIALAMLFAVDPARSSDSAAGIQVVHRTVRVGELDVFYREAGPDSGPVVLLLHGFPSSSRMFRDLIPRLSDAYRIIAPDYPAFGHSAVPGRSAFGYTFDHLAGVVDGRPSWEQWEDMGRVGYATAAAMWARTSLRPSDVDVVQSYENFTGGVVMSLIEHGLCSYESANEFIRVPDSTGRVCSLLSQN